MASRGMTRERSGVCAKFENAAAGFWRSPNAAGRSIEEAEEEAMKEFPKVLFVRSDSNNAVFDPLAYTRVQDAVGDDGPTNVAQYQLVTVRRLRKEVVEAK
jgi:hypothetical protein